MAVADMQVIGTTHAAIGAYLLVLWGLPDAHIDAVTLYHSLSGEPKEGLSLVVITHAADALALAGPDILESHGIIDGIDITYFNATGRLADLKSWRQACAQHVVESPD